MIELDNDYDTNFMPKIYIIGSFSSMSSYMVMCANNTLFVLQLIQSVGWSETGVSMFWWIQRAGLKTNTDLKPSPPLSLQV